MIKRTRIVLFASLFFSTLFFSNAKANVSYESVLAPGAKIKAGDLSKNEFFILIANEEVTKAVKSHAAKDKTNKPHTHIDNTQLIHGVTSSNPASLEIRNKLIQPLRATLNVDAQKNKVQKPLASSSQTASSKGRFELQPPFNISSQRALNKMSESTIPKFSEHPLRMKDQLKLKALDVKDPLLLAAHKSSQHKIMTNHAVNQKYVIKHKLFNHPKKIVHSSKTIKKVVIKKQLHAQKKLIKPFKPQIKPFIPSSQFIGQVKPRKIVLPNKQSHHA